MKAIPESTPQPGVHHVWPQKVDLFGVGYTPTTYQEASDAIIQAASQNLAGVVACHAVHAVVTCSTDVELKEKVNQFDMLTPDGQPVRWGLNLLYGADLPDRVYGPELMLRLCERAAATGIPVYFYGGSDVVIIKLVRNLADQFPELEIAGYESPPFRALTEEEDSPSSNESTNAVRGLCLSAWDARSRTNSPTIIGTVSTGFKFALAPPLTFMPE